MIYQRVESFGEISKKVLTFQKGVYIMVNGRFCEKLLQKRRNPRKRQDERRISREG